VLVRVLLRGDVDTTVQQASVGLAQPLGLQMDWRLSYQNVGWNTDLVNDPRMTRRLAELNAGTLAAAEEVRDFMAELDGSR
jgi:hypothetical protein